VPTGRHHGDVSTAINYGDDVVLDIRCTYGQYRDDPWPSTSDALTTGEQNWFAVLCGTRHGHVTVRVQLLSAAPKDDIDDSWEMVGERVVGRRSPAVAAVAVSRGMVNVRLRHRRPRR
jgi:hypothetical protein